MKHDKNIAKCERVNIKQAETENLTGIQGDDQLPQRKNSLKVGAHSKKERSLLRSVDHFFI